MKQAIKNEKETKMGQLNTRLSRVEKELDACRGTVIEDGWQTQRYARKMRKWDVLAQEKMALKQMIDDLENSPQIKIT